MSYNLDQIPREVKDAFIQAAPFFTKMLDAINADTPTSFVATAQDIEGLKNFITMCGGMDGILPLVQNMTENQNSIPIEPLPPLDILDATDLD